MCSLIQWKQIYSMIPTESVLWFLSDFSVESESEVPHEDEQTVTVTHSSAVLKGALSSLSKNLSMKANSLPENPARRNYLITMHVWLTGSVWLLIY